MHIFIIILLPVSCVIAVYTRNNLTVEEMVIGEGYPLEIHRVTTADGYILTLHRIPHGKAISTTSRKPVLLVHALMCTSSFWLLYPEESLGYALADAGYDVWIVNTRGNSYSRRHTTLDPDGDRAFWDFSWHEVGVHDLPATIDYTIQTTGVDSVYFCGHSQGNTALFVLASLRPEYNSKIKAQVSLGPIAFLGRSRSPTVRMASALGLSEFHFRVLSLANGLGEFMPQQSGVRTWGERHCRGRLMEVFCAIFIMFMSGPNDFETSPSRIPVIIGHAPAGASSKQQTHYVQLAASGRFRQYDYGPYRNLEVYGRMSPPEYDLSKVTMPGLLVHGSHDWTATVEDVKRLHRLLGNTTERYFISDRPYNHLDYMCAESVAKFVTPKIVEFFEKN